LQFPYVGIQYTSLGGEERASFMVTVSIQPKAEWQNGILQNSQYSIFRVNKEPIGYVVENFSGSLPKFRKFNAETLEELINKLNIYFGKVSVKSSENLKEVAPPNFPKELHDKILSQYKGNSEKAYATMWAITNKGK